MVTVGSEQRDIPASDFQHNLQQIVDVATDLLSKCFLEREESQRYSATSDDPSCSDMTAEGSEQRNAEIPYSGKFSRVQIFAKITFPFQKKFSRF